MAFDEAWQPLAEAYRRVPVAHERPGWVEKDAEAVVDSVADTLGEVAADVGPARIAAVGLDNEGETVLAWDAETLRPLAPAVVWSSRQSEAVVERLRRDGAEALVRERAGTPLDPYFSSTKMRWLAEERPAVAAALADGRARFGTLDAYICARLAGGARSEPSTAARTQLQALRRPGRWDDELCRLFAVEATALPELGPTAGELGTLRLAVGQLPLRALVLDQTAALAGHGCVAPGAAKATYGTGIFVLAHAGAEPPADAAGLLPTVAWQLGERCDYALDGGVFSAGSAVDWLRDGAGLLADAAESETLARSVEDAGGVRFVPALTGLGAPWWRPSARAAWVGIGPHVRAAHLVRAVLEGLAWRVRDVVEALGAAGVRPELLRADGGMTANRWLMQRQADALGIPVRVAATSEATALGAAALAGIGAGLWPLERLEELGREGETFTPAAGGERERDRAYAAWRELVEAVAALPDGT